MLDDVPENVRRSRDDDYNFFLPRNKYLYLHHYPEHKLIYNWNNLPLLLKSVVEPCQFRTELKSHFLAKYKTECIKENCLAITPKKSLVIFRLHLSLSQ